MSSSERPKWWPISCTSTCLTIAPNRLLVLGPVIKDRPPVEPDHVRHLDRVALGAERQADALKQAEQVELAFGAHMVEHLFGRKIVDLDDDIGAKVAETARQAAVNIAREQFEFGERRRFQRSPRQRIGCDIGHSASLARIVGARLDSLYANVSGWAKMACDVTRMPDRHCLRRRFFGPRRRMAGRRANADADGRRAFGHHSADCAATHRHQSAADLSTLREPVRDSISAERDGAVPGKALLVAAGIALRISERWSHAWCATPSRPEGRGWGEGARPPQQVLGFSTPSSCPSPPWGEGTQFVAWRFFRSPSRPGMTLPQCHSRTSTKCPATAAAAAMAGDTRCVRPL